MNPTLMAEVTLDHKQTGMPVTLAIGALFLT
jgi:hypothetical protein